jgi:hypothetical protein
MKKTLFIVMAMMAMLTACVPFWTHLASPTLVKDPTYSVELPSDWVRRNQTAKGNVAITHDGMGIQSIFIEQNAHAKAFPNLKKSASPTMLPSELAELQLAELKTFPALSNIEVLKNTPQTVSGLPGFRMHMRFKNVKGLTYEFLWLGVVNAKGYYSLNYRAPSIHYFPKHKPDFEKIVDSFRLL